eukprot:3975457-Pleurochrysis_carterae.AAC.1
MGRGTVMIDKYAPTYLLGARQRALGMARGWRDSLCRHFLRKGFALKAEKAYRQERARVMPMRNGILCDLWCACMHAHAQPCAIT